MQDNSDLLFDCQRSETPGLVELCNAFSAHKFRLPSQGHAVDVNKAWAELRGEVHSAYNIGGSGEEKGKAQTGKEHGLITRWYNRVSGTVDEWINFLPTWDDMNETYAGFLCYQRKISEEPGMRCSSRQNAESTERCSETSIGD